MDKENKGEQLTDKVLQYLDKKGSADSLKLADEWKEDHQKIVGAVKSLQSLGGVIEAEQLSRTKTELTAEGKSFVEHGSHEAIVYNTVPPGEDGLPQTELNAKAGPAAKIGMSKAMQNGWVKIVKSPGANKVVRSVDSIEDKVREILQSIIDGSGSSVPTASLADLKKRKLLVQTPVNYYNIKRGAEFTTSVVKLETELTPEMLATGDWRQKKFKAYNFKALGAPLNSGHLHPLMKVRSEFRSILLEMGFSEMPTNRFVESSFWNFDALYVPQKHPARDAQDTFFMSQPVKCTSVPEEFMAKVRAAHTGTDYGTLGYGPDWKEEEAYKNCMRTHTTAVSARMLHAIGSKPEFKPSKLFSIDRVFRNETLDATHLAEFHQVEGVVADYNINLGNLIGIMKEFFGRLGISKLRFKPAYNPYTEPSMEVFSYHEGLKKWVEIGNSGMFRPEMLLPMGIPKDVRVIAWGLSLERPTMIRYGIDNIRDLVGPKVDLQMVYNNPICRLDKNFTIGTDGSYLDNPLLKSPKRGKNLNPAAGQFGDQQPQKKSKNRKRKKKSKSAGENNEINETVNSVNVSGETDNKPSQENKQPLQVASQPKSQTSQKSKKNNKPKKLESEATENKADSSHSVTPSDPRQPKPVPTEETVTIPQGDSAHPATTSKSSKRKRKPKVKPVDSAS